MRLERERRKVGDNPRFPIRTDCGGPEEAGFQAVEPVSLGPWAETGAMGALEQSRSGLCQPEHGKRERRETSV